MMSKNYAVCDQLIWSLSKLGLHERKIVYTATHLNAWWADENNGLHAIMGLAQALHRLYDDEPRLGRKAREYRQLYRDLSDYWGKL